MVSQKLDFSLGDEADKVDNKVASGTLAMDIKQDRPVLAKVLKSQTAVSAFSTLKETRRDVGVAGAGTNDKLHSVNESIVPDAEQ